MGHGRPLEPDITLCKHCRSTIRRATPNRRARWIHNNTGSVWCHPYGTDCAEPLDLPEENAK